MAVLVLIPFIFVFIVYIFFNRANKRTDELKKQLRDNPDISEDEYYNKLEGFNKEVGEFWRRIVYNSILSIIGYYLVSTAFYGMFTMVDIGVNRFSNYYGCPNSKRIGRLNLKKDMG